MGLQLKNFDMAGNRPQLSYKSVNIYQSKTGAIFSICFLMIAFFIIAFKVFHVYQKQQIYVTQQVQKKSVYTPLYLNNSNFRLGLFTQDQQGARARTIKYQQQSKFGINVTIYEYFAVVDEKGVKYTSNIFKAVSCSSGERFCLPPELQLRVLGNIEITIGENTGELYRRYAFQVRLCDPGVDAQCQNYTSNIAYAFLFDSVGIYPNKLVSSEVFAYNTTTRGFQTHPVFETSKTQTLSLFFRNITFVTDESVLPEFIYAYAGMSRKTVINQTWYYDQEKEKQIFDTDGTMLQIYLKRSLYSITYYRKYVKLDQIAGQIFGLLALTSGILFFLYSGYNQWSFKQRKLQEMGHQYINPSLCSYYLFLLRKCKCLPCFNSISRLSSQSEGGLVMKDLDIGNLGERVRVLEQRQRILESEIQIKEEQSEKNDAQQKVVDKRESLNYSFNEDESLQQNFLKKKPERGQSSRF